jgi:TonB family protein
MLYLLQMTFCWGVFALLYQVWLRHETFFSVNRFYLLTGFLLGLLIPFFPDWQVSSVGNTAAAFDPAAVVKALPSVVVHLGNAEDALPGSSWMPFVTWIYTAGAVLAGLRYVAGLWHLRGIALRARRERQPDGCILLYTAALDYPASFFRWIFLPDDPEKASDIARHPAVIAHERAHVHGLHTVDVLISEAICVVFWFHPLAYWYRRALRQVHEYIADAAASRQTTRKQYGLLLIRQAQTGNVPALVHHFFQSPLKQRLIMLTKKDSPAMHGWKYALALPLFALSVWCCKGTDEQLEKEIAAEIAAKNAAAAITAALETAAKSKEAVYVESTPEGVKVKPMPSKKIREKTDQKGTGAVATDSDVLDLFDIDVPPSFPGGEKELLNFLKNNIKYPMAAQAQKIEGNVAITFIIDQDGRVTAPQIIKNVAGGCGEEAVRVIASMPNWTPAMEAGKPVSVRYTLPVRFKLD